VTADYLFENLSEEQFEKVLWHLRQGVLEARARILWIDESTASRFDNKKHELVSTSWKYFDLRLPGVHRKAEHVYLIDYDSEQIHKDITLESSQVNRVLELTSQGGGQKPKMPPRLYAFLTVWYAKHPFENDPETLLSILEERDDIWGNAGVIDGRRGLDAIKEYLRALEEFETAGLHLDISIASDV
jgi:hypothetical protein